MTSSLSPDVFLMEYTDKQGLEITVTTVDFRWFDTRGAADYDD